MARVKNTSPAPLTVLGHGQAAPGQTLEVPEKVAGELIASGAFALVVDDPQAPPVNDQPAEEPADSPAPEE
ncbi:MAG: hypothetical protein V1806_03745 [Pseudomonadota bacterium]